VPFLFMTTNELITTYISSFADTDRRDLLTEFLNTIADDLDSAPASSKIAFHHAYPGGLLQHISEVIYTMESLNNGLANAGNCNLSEDSMRTVAILHDIHKARDIAGNPQYVQNVLKNGSVSEKIPYKTNEHYFNWAGYDLLNDIQTNIADSTTTRGLAWFLTNSAEIKNTGVKSLILIAAESPALMASLSESEVNAIRYHGGAYETSKYELQGKEDELLILLHAADMLSSRNG
jgi:hypothetical protein